MAASILNFPSDTLNVHAPRSQNGRIHEYIQFPSGLKCMLICDPSSSSFSTAACIGAGSFNDPSDLPGLAHLCEHAIVMDTTTTKLQKEVLASGGTINAYTGSDQTSFGFEISTFAVDPKIGSPFLAEPLLDVFAGYFQIHKFSESVISQELKAVHEEHNFNVADVSKILWHGLRLLSSSAHPFHQFSTGCNSTFEGFSTRKLSARVSKHYSRFQSSNTAIVMKGPQSVNHLKKLAVKAFEHLISQSSRTVSETTEDASLFKQSDPNFLYILNEESRLRLCFEVPDSTSPSVLRVLCNMMGDESKDTYCHYLKTKNFAESVLVYTQDISTRTSIFIIELELTPHGLRNIVRIMSSFFAFKEMLLDTNANEMMEIVEEYVTIDDYMFESQEPTDSDLDSSVLYAERLQSGLQPEAIIRGHSEKLHSGKLVGALKDLITSMITEENVKVQLMDKDVKSVLQLSPELTELERDPYYEFQYLKFQVDFGSKIQAFDAPCKLPRPLAPFSGILPILLELPPSESFTKHRGMSTGVSDPELLVVSPRYELWVQKVTGHKAVISAYVEFLVEPTSENICGIEIVIALASESLKHTLYNLEQFGCLWGVFANVNGEPSVLVTVEGKAQLLSHVLDIIMSEIRSCFSEMSSRSYEEIKRSRIFLRKKYEEYANATGVKQVLVRVLELFEEGLVSPVQRMEALELVDQTYLVDLGASIMGCSNRASVLVSGSLNCSDLKEISTIGRGPSYNKPLFSTFIPPAEKTLRYDISGSSGDSLVVVYYYVQLGCRSSSEAYSTAKFLEEMMSVSALANLRTKRGLGYGNLTGLKVFKQSFGYFVMVSTVQHQCEHVASQIELFFEDMGAELSRMSTKAFEQKKRAFLESQESDVHADAIPSNHFAEIKPLRGSDNQNHGELYATHWNNLEQILNQTHRFGGTRCEEKVDVEVVQRLTQGQLARFYQRHFVTGRSAVVIMKSAGELSRNDLIKALSAQLSKKLADESLLISQEDLQLKLQTCEDLETLSDLSLSDHFPRAGQQLKLKKLQLKLKAARMIRRAVSRDQAEYMCDGKIASLAQFHHQCTSSAKTHPPPRSDF